MDTQEQLAERFEEHRDHLDRVAYRMLGSVADAHDAVQDTWLRLARTDVDDRSDIANLRGWLTTVVSRICLDVLRSRRSRPEAPLVEHLPDPVVTRLEPDPRTDPEVAAEQADSVTLAMLVVLETLRPPERMAFVLHDMFGVPFDEIGEILGSSTAAATQMASRARRRVRAAPPAAADRATQRRVLDAFTSAARTGDFDALVAVLDPDVVLRADAAGDRPAILVRGAETVASRAIEFRRAATDQVQVLVNGAVGLVSVRDGRPTSVFSPVVRDGRIVEINILADPERLARLDLDDLHDIG